MRIALTPRQAEVYRAVEALTAGKETGTTVREVAAHLGSPSPSSIWRVLKQLRQKGWVQDDVKFRGYAPAEPDLSHVPDLVLVREVLRRNLFRKVPEQWSKT